MSLQEYIKHYKGAIGTCEYCSFFKACAEKKELEVGGCNAHLMYNSNED